MIDLDAVDENYEQGYTRPCSICGSIASTQRERHRMVLTVDGDTAVDGFVVECTECRVVVGLIPEEGHEPE